MKPVGVFTWLAVSAVLSAATWYVSPAGSPSGNGSQSAPWDLQTGLSQPLASGDTLILETGTYTGTVSSALTGVVIVGAGATLNGSISIKGIQESGNVSYNWNGAAPALTCFVLPDAYTPGRAHIAVYNLNGKAKSVSCNVATLGLPNGTQLHLRSVENYAGAPVQVSISNQKITVPLTGWSVAQPIGWPTPHSTLPFFGAFVVTQ